jgi:hypothetical protein
MNSSELNAALKPFRQIANNNALSPIYRSLAVSAKRIRGEASFAHLDAAVDLPLEREICVDTRIFLAVVDSLPSNSDLTLEANENVLAWKCGSASGRLALAAIDIPKVPWPRTGNAAFTPTDAFKQALELGALSCADQTTDSSGLRGVVIDNRGDLTIASSDATTLSVASLDLGFKDWPDLVTMPPDGMRLLASVITADEGDLAFQAAGKAGDPAHMYYSDTKLRCAIPQAKALTRDLAKTVKEYSGEKVTAELPRERVRAFIKRIAALAESRYDAYVELGAKKGRLTLGFMEGVVTTDEYYLVESLKKIPDLEPVRLNAIKLGRALEHVDRVVLDYIDKRAVVLRGDGFGYIIAGHSPK